MKNPISRLVALITFLAMACVGGAQAGAASIVVDHNMNILQGLQLLAQQNPTRYTSTIVRNPTADWFSDRKAIGGIGQCYNGGNGDLEGKMRDFAHKVTSHTAVAMMKLCYVDRAHINLEATSGLPITDIPYGAS